MIFILTQAKQVITSLKLHNIRKLTSIYITISLEDITSIVGLRDVAEAEQFLLKMVAEKQIKASIDQRTKIVRFGYSDCAQTASSSAVKIMENKQALQGLERHIKATLEVSNKLRDLQQKIITGEEYLSRSAKVGGVLGKGGLSQSDTLSWADNDAHRDLLGFPTA